MHTQHFLWRYAYALHLDFAAFAGCAVFACNFGLAMLGGGYLMGVLDGTVAACLQWQDKPLSWILRELAGLADTRYKKRSFYNLCDTLGEAAYLEGNNCIGDAFNKWRKLFDCDCNQNALFVTILYKVNKGGKCYDPRIIKTR